MKAKSRKSQQKFRRRFSLSTGLRGQQTTPGCPRLGEVLRSQDSEEAAGEDPLETQGAAPPSPESY